MREYLWYSLGYETDTAALTASTSSCGGNKGIHGKRIVHFATPVSTALNVLRRVEDHIRAEWLILEGACFLRIHKKGVEGTNNLQLSTKPTINH